MEGVYSRTRSSLGSKRRRRITEPVIFYEQGREVIFIDDGDSSGEEEALEHQHTNKGENLVASQNPITAESSDSDDLCSSSDSDETNDDSDYEACDEEEEENESSYSEASSSSDYDYEDDDHWRKKKHFRVYSKEVDDMVRKAKQELEKNVLYRQDLKNEEEDHSTSNTFEKKIKACSSSAEKLEKPKMVKKQNVSADFSRPSHERKVYNSRGGVFMDENEGYCRLQRSRPELRLLEMLAECYHGNKNSMAAYSIQIEENDGEADQEKDCGGENLLWSFADKVEPLQRSKSEEELDKLWEEMDLYSRLEEVDAQIGHIGTPSTNSGCKHELYLDEQIGSYCKLCGTVATEIKYMCSRVVDRFPYEGSGKRLPFGEENISAFDESQFNASSGDSDAEFSNNKGTVWSLIPDIKQSLYPHQQEGFEFIWRNLAGNIDLQKLKSVDPCSEGGCIISHAPGTGKTRLTIVFLQAYLKVFPNCLPVIVAPASLLLTWEDEFKKWDIGVPFHNLNNPELSGREHRDCISSVDMPFNQQLSEVTKRMVKLCSWLKEKSILGISYNLYERLAGDVGEKKHKKNLRGDKKQASVKEKTDYGMMGQVLLENPGLLVFDEGHTPRNERSKIWKVLSKVQTKRRIILSGTPFQNTLQELYSTLRLVKTSFAVMIPPELKKFCQKRTHQKKESEEWKCQPVFAGNSTDDIDKINQLKFLLDPLVHVYKDSILQNNLPGLRHRELSLKPNSLQEEILQSIEGSPNGLDSVHKLSLVSVHPSLFLCCKPQTRKEESSVESHRKQLEKLSLDPYGGIKTRFLVEFVKLCDAMNEKVLVFSQFIDPLRLIINQLKSCFNWSEGKEVLQMNGKLSAKEKQFLIHTFNDERSEAKIMLASTKACSEGINLVGASRVVLLDVVWNPSVERQAISRAYRLGQKRVVYTYRLITPIEVSKLRKQAEKDWLSELVFSARDVEDGETKRCAIDWEDRVFDKMFNHAELKDMFAEPVVHPSS